MTPAAESAGRVMSETKTFWRVVDGGDGPVCETVQLRRRVGTLSGQFYWESFPCGPFAYYEADLADEGYAPTEAEAWDLACAQAEQAATAAWKAWMKADAARTRMAAARQSARETAEVERR